VQEGSTGEFPIGHHVVGKAPAGVFDGAAQEPAGGAVLAIPGAVPLQGSGGTGSDKTAAIRKFTSRFSKCWLLLARRRRSVKRR
jgi:hypothetical protein